MCHVLLVDGSPQEVLAHLDADYPGSQFRLTVVKTGAEALATAAVDPPDVAVLGTRLPDGSGLDLFGRLREQLPRLPVIFVAASLGAETAIEVMKRGAYDFLHLADAADHLDRVVREAAELARRVGRGTRKAAAGPPAEPAGELIGECPAMAEVFKAIGRVAAQDVPVLITGESGTGKELVARAIFRHSARSDRRFLALNCAAIPETLLESELFGHEKGAFTGADRKHIGKFEQCNGGTLFLDEIGDMPLLTQAKMLRVMQDQTFERVGGSEAVRTNVRVVAATHRDVKGWAAEGRFRPDLYYRLGVFTIHLPPLRDRLDDLPVLVRHYLERFGPELGRQVHEIDPDALWRLRQYSWPGNVRELQSVLKQALLRATGPVLLPSFLPPLVEKAIEGQPPEPAVNAGLDAVIRDRLGSRSCDLYEEVHDYVDRVFLSQVLEHTGGNQRQAARRLGIARQTLRLRTQKLGLRMVPVIGPYGLAVEAEDEKEPVAARSWM
jgi:two-component system nitrogen regulation response regulator GlnG